MRANFFNAGFLSNFFSKKVRGVWGEAPKILLKKNLLKKFTKKT